MANCQFLLRFLSGAAENSQLEGRPLKPSHIANKSTPTHSKSNNKKEPITNSVSSNEPMGGSVANSTPTLELMHKDNQTIFTLSSAQQETPPGGASSAGSHSRSDSRISTDSQSLQSENADSSIEFQSIQKRRSKLMETFAAKSPNEQPGTGVKTRPVMEVKPRPTSTSSDTSRDQPANRQVLKGAKPVFPKPTVKPKPPGKKPNTNKKQGGIQQVVNEALSLIDTNRVGWTNELDPFLR